MNYAIIDGTTIKSTGTIQELFPTTAFSATGPNADFLTANNVVELVETLSYTSPTQKLSTVEPYFENGKAYSVKVESTTTEEQTNLNNTKWTDVRRQRDILLKETDWRAMSDRTLTDAWRDFRQELRQIPQTQTDPFNITWPTEPS
tara:strand:- start:60 stop:497 length:438 start_codon:yes stop_codon:yes gene_type:complete